MNKGLIRILYIATSDIHLHAFHRPYILWLHQLGHKVDVAIENRGNYKIEGVNKVFEIKFPRSLLKRELLSSYKQLKGVIEHGSYDLIHCHTPIPSMLARIAARKARINGTKVLYTAHGFHFYKGAPLSRWLVYYTAEYFLSHFTDGIITINKEDFGYVKDKMFHKDSFYIKGIGVDSGRFKNLSIEERLLARKNLGYSDRQFILLYIAEFIPRKNHKFVIDSLPGLKKKIPGLKMIFAGTGILFDEMKKYAQSKEVDDVTEFLGFRNDVHVFAEIADIGISSSKHEGLGLGLAEQMMCGVPVIATVDRGHKEMIDHGINGYFFAQNDSAGFIEKVIELYNNPEKRKEMGKNAIKKAEIFNISNSLNSMKEIYNYYLNK